MNKDLTTATNTTGDPIFIVQIVQGPVRERTLLPLRQADGTTLEEAKAASRHYVSQGHTVRLLASLDGGKTGRVVDYRF